MSDSDFRNPQGDPPVSTAGSSSPPAPELSGTAASGSTDAWATLKEILRSPEPKPRDSRTDATVAESLLGRSVGGFTLRRLIGSGGMGVVYEADQSALGRAVALKIIRPDSVSVESIRRFELEGRLLGRLKHPQIAQIYEAGVVDLGSGPQPFFAMELVEGRPLLAYASQAALSTRSRLSLLAQIADAVHHAHQRQVIHRDLKPDNILIAADGTPKILDFGVARAIDEQLERTRATEVGQIIGTLPYMSPEQARGELIEVDTRTDIYSLGVVLYELISGRRPIELRGRPLHDAVRVITEQPPAPLSSLNRSLRGDIEKIVGTALAKDKEERYASASALATDIRRYLNDEPILAKPPGLWTQIRKFAKRNRLLVGGVAAIVVMSTGFGVVSRELLQRERAAVGRERVASAQAAHELRLRGVYEQWFDDVLNADPSANLRLIDIANRMAAKLNSDQQPLEVEAYLRAKLGALFLGVGDYVAARTQLGSASDMSAHLSRDALSGLRQTQARLAFEADADTRAAEALLLEARQLAGEDGGAAPLDIWSSLGAFYFELDREIESQRAFAQAEARQHELPGPHSGEFLANQAYLFVAAGEYVAAEALYRAALRADRAIGLADTPDFALTQGNLAFALAYQGQCRDALALAEQSLSAQVAKNGEKHRAIAAAQSAVAFARLCDGDLPGAEKTYRDALTLQIELFGKSHQAVAFTTAALAAVVAEQGRDGEGQSLYDESQAIYAKVIGRTHRTAIWFYYGLRGQRQTRRGEHAQARAAYEAGRSAFAALGRKGDRYRAQCEMGLARLGAAAGDVAAALELADQTVNVLEQSVGPEHPLVATALGDRARLRCMAKDETGACDDIQRARRIRESLGPEAAWTAAELTWAVCGRGAEQLGPLSACMDVATDVEALEGSLGSEDVRVRALREAIARHDRQGDGG